MLKKIDNSSDINVSPLKNLILTTMLNNKNIKKLTGYVLTKRFGRIWQSTHQQVYRELADLESQGMLIHKQEINIGKPDSKLYQLTEEGRAFATLIQRTPVKHHIKPYRQDLILAAYQNNEASILLTIEEINRYIAYYKKTLANQEHLNPVSPEYIEPMDRILIQREIDLREVELKFLFSSMAILENKNFAA